MNKVILGLILAVCVLGMALVMLNERLGRESDQSRVTQIGAASQLQSEAAGERRELEEQLAEALPVNTPPVPEMPVSPIPSKTNAELDTEQQLAEARASLAPPLPESPAPREDVAAAPVIAPKQPAAQPAPQVTPKPVPAKTAPAQTAPKKTESIPVEKPAAQVAEKSDKEKTVNRFVIYSRENGATIRIGGTSRINYSSMTLENPDRIVLDMEGQWQFPPNPGVPKNELVSNVRTGKNGDKTRLVIDLKTKPRTVRVIPAKNGDGLDIRVDK